ncbi:BREX system P-loop protein BrxC [Gracilimonas sp.]|uniref:BREX system P-loop protein BrxC n=1 Tax=Gracilimonas sp. TaxID=1974203 RepID=UPI003D0EF949
MSFYDYFEHDVSRDIETVIKADDESQALDEIKEYVITKEISKKIATLFEAYNNYAGANGVWISGFFGSGKSHLLKILSYVLSNKTVDGNEFGKMFADKIQDSLLKADVLKAVSAEAESILFNIDQKADENTTEVENVILHVFNKVFNEHLGYYGEQGHVANFERWLTEEGKYEDFKKQFGKEYDESWIDARRKYFHPKVKSAAAQVLGNLFNDNPDKYKSILSELKEDYSLSVDKLCADINRYMETKGDDFRLNFFVDEVGQFISDNTQLKLKLQSIAEKLATTTNGKAWVFVTSQEDLERVVGQIGKGQEYDFSQIEARFKNRISLTSANVDEVIEKRLLKKNETGSNKLSKVWQKEEANLETILRFTDGVHFRWYKDENEFINKYPFITYQFHLFQECMRGLSENNAFQGKHQSVGERSMLGVFQEVLKDSEDKDIGYFVSFDKTFDGNRKSIRGELQASINLAENNLGDDFAIQVLKALFMVKYYRQFKPTLRNISILMIDKININPKKHEDRVKEALNKLESQIYIQRNGELYEYLTNEEKDIEKQIKNTSIENKEITGFLSEVIYNDIISDSKFRYEGNKQEYSFSKYIDGISQGRDQELTIDVITPYHPHFDEMDTLKNQAMGYNKKLTFVLPAHERLIKDVMLYLQTKLYIKRTRSSDISASVNTILSAKEQKNIERKAAIKRLVDDLLGKSKVLTGQGPLEMGDSSNGKQKVAKAFQELVKIAYPNLKMLGDITYTQATVQQILSDANDDLFDPDDSAMSEAETDMFGTVNRRQQRSDRTTIHDLLDHYQKNSYGWYPEAILAILAKLSKRGKVEISKDGNLLDDETAKDALFNKALYNNIQIKPQADFKAGDVRLLVEVYSEAFDEPCPHNDGKDVALAFKDKLKETATEIHGILQQHRREYPFVTKLQKVYDLFKELAEKEYSQIVKQVSDFEEELLNAKEQLLDPIRQFINSEEQRRIFDDIKRFATGDNPNLSYIDGDEVEQVKQIYQDPEPYKGSTLRDAKDLVDTLKEKLNKAIDDEREQAIQEIKSVLQDLESKDEYQALDEDDQQKVTRTIESALRDVETTPFINQLTVNVMKVKQTLKGNALTTLSQLYNKRKGTSDKAAEPAATYVSFNSVLVDDFPKSELNTEEDVKEYCSKLEDRLLKMLKENKRISL